MELILVGLIGSLINPLAMLITLVPLIWWRKWSAVWVTSFLAWLPDLFYRLANDGFIRIEYAIGDFLGIFGRVGVFYALYALIGFFRRPLPGEGPVDSPTPDSLVGNSSNPRSEQKCPANPDAADQRDNASTVAQPMKPATDACPAPTTTSGRGSDRLARLRFVELSVGGLFAIGVVSALGHESREWFVGLSTLAAWTIAPAFIRPLTFPDITTQQRYAVSALILGAGMAWGMWLGETVTESYGDYSKLGILLVFGFVGVALFLRLGWKTATPKSLPEVGEKG